MKKLAVADKELMTFIIIVILAVIVFHKEASFGWEMHWKEEECLVDGHTLGECMDLVKRLTEEHDNKASKEP